jgi:hypothetical protein
VAIALEEGLQVGLVFSPRAKEFDKWFLEDKTFTGWPPAKDRVIVTDAIDGRL